MKIYLNLFLKTIPYYAAVGRGTKRERPALPPSTGAGRRNEQPDSNVKAIKPRSAGQGGAWQATAGD